MFKKEEKGFTLIELLIVVAILGALAAVVIPNVGRFIGRGESEAKETEFSNIQSAVVAMMVDNRLSSLPNPVDSIPTNDMSQFPDTSVCGIDKLKDIDGNNFALLFDKDGYILYGHDIIADGATTNLVNYVTTQNTTYRYTLNAQGTVTQYDTAP
ncbi:type II secretion system protein [Chloroflexota bacterium]